MAAHRGKGKFAPTKEHQLHVKTLGLRNIPYQPLLIKTHLQLTCQRKKPRFFKNWFFRKETKLGLFVLH